MDISRTNCVHADCQEPVWFRRLCRIHHKAKYPEEKIREYCFRWELIEEFTATVRAESREMAKAMVEKGMIKGKKDISSVNIPLPRKVECVKEMAND